MRGCFPKFRNLDYVVLAIFVSAACGERTPHAELTPELLSNVRPFVPATEKGQTATLLSSGQWLFLGGESSRGAASLLDIKTGRHASIRALRHPRSGHTTTVLPDGSVLVLGGIGADGQIVKTAELFDPATRQFSDIEGLQSLARANHSATLLTDGHLLVVGGSTGAELSPNPILWNPFTHNIEQSHATLKHPRTGHAAVLLPSGTVLVTGGVDAASRPIKQSEIFNSKTQQIAQLDQEEKSRLSAEPMKSRAPKAEEVVVSGALEKLEYVPGIRFSKPLDPRTLTRSTVTLMSANGAVPVKPVSAEHSMILFLHPETELLPGSDYDVFIKGAVDEAGTRLAFVALHFRTPDATAQDRTAGRSDLPQPSSLYSAATAVTVSAEQGLRLVRLVRELDWQPDPRAPGQDDELWIPQAEHFRGRWLSKLPPVPDATGPRAPSGVTALAGRVLRMNGRPLANVTLRIGATEAKTDGNGFFLLSGLAAGFAPLDIDGTTANRRDVFYGSYTAQVEVKSGMTTRLPYIIWMPKLDPQGTVRIPSPTTQETVVSSPAIPGLELHIPAGTVIRDRKGNVVTEVNVTAVPANQAPFPVPSLDVPVNFTFQPGGAVLQRLTPEAKKATLYYPNYQRQAPGAKALVWNYDPTGVGWFVYGLGTVSADGKQLIPDRGVVLQEFTGAMFNGSGPPSPDGGPGGGDDGADCGANPNAGCPGSDDGGEPVSLLTGQFMYQEKDLFLPDALPISVSRTYRSFDLNRRMFGIGWTLNYDMLFWSANQYQEVDLILPTGKRIHYSRFSPGTSWTDAKFISYARGIWYGSRVEWNSSRNGWDLFFKDGSRWFFGENAPLQEMTDRFGNKITMTRTPLRTGPITRISSSNGRWVQFTVNSDDLVTAATDSGGRTFTYSYDGSDRLVSVTNANSESHSFEYTSDNRLFRIRSAKGDVLLENTYWPNSGAVTQQSLADGSHFAFSYSYASTGFCGPSNNWSTCPGVAAAYSTTVTDRSGKIRSVTFNPRTDSQGGRIVSSTYMPGTPYEQVTTFQYQPNADILSSVNDSLGRQTAYVYDAMGNLTSMTKLAGTAAAVTWSYTYSSDSNQITSVTDPLGHTTTFAYDSLGNLTTITDALGHSTTFTHDGQGRVTQLSNALGQSTSFAYQGPDLVTITDALSRQYQLAYDAVGRVVAAQDPAGNTKQFSYDGMSRLTSAVDAGGNSVRFGYDVNGNMTSSTDQRSNTTLYGYDALNRLSSRTDPLGNSETFTYATNGKPAQHVDRNGHISLRQYDPLDRLSSIGFGATAAAPTTYESTINYTYDSGNRVTAVLDSADGELDYSYDGMDRVTSETTPRGTVQYTYDLDGRRITMTPTSQPVTQFGYDDANRLQQITSGSDVVQFGYDDANRRTHVQLPNAVTMDYTYDGGGQLTRIDYGNSAGPIGDLTYSYDAAGRVIHLGGSLGSMVIPAATTGAAYNANNQLTTSNGATLSYDLNGNLISDGTRTFTWDARGQLTSISGANTVAQFSYDARGRRIRKSVNGTAMQFLYDGANALQELSDGALPSLQASTLSGFGLDETYGRTNADGTKTEYLTDRLGSTLALSDTSGALTTTYAYEPYGAMSRSGATTNNARTFTGRDDDGTGLLYFRSRYYNPQLARFISEDPINLHGGMNFYRYVGSSPLNYIDPLGLTITVNGNLGDYQQAVDYLSRDPGMAAIIRDLVASSTNYSINFNSVEDDSYNPATHTINWDSHSALRCSDSGGGTQSPALGLGHEMSHADAPWYWKVLETLDALTGLIPWGGYDNMEEWRVITGPETRAAQTLGEGTRTDHQYHGTYWVPIPISR